MRIDRWMWWRRGGIPPTPQGTFVVEAQMERSEDLRADVLGVPSEDEVRDDRPHDPWRPARTLGKIPKR